MSAGRMVYVPFEGETAYTIRECTKPPRPSLPVQGEERGYGKRDSAVIGDSKQSVEKERTETGEVRTCCT